MINRYHEGYIAGCRKTRDEWQAINADLLEALRVVLQVATDEFDGEPWQAIEKARAAIAKAKQAKQAEE